MSFCCSALGNSQLPVLGEKEVPGVGFFVSRVFHLKQCQLRAHQGRVIKCHYRSWFSGVLPGAGSVCSVTEFYMYV